jgi:hypothetical protein
MQFFSRKKAQKAQQIAENPFALFCGRQSFEAKLIHAVHFGFAKLPAPGWFAALPATCFRSR